MKIIIHGGLLEDATPKELSDKEQALTEIVKASYQILMGGSATEAAIFAVQQLEDNSLFNAGTGSKLQQDGTIRMSASLMDGDRETFSGVINIEAVRNPIAVAALLQKEQDRVLSGQGATAYARQQGIGPYNVETEERRSEFEKKSNSKRTGTVGCVALDSNGVIAAATSTGGKGMELSCRVSDSATVAGNYANSYCGVSCTGVGEDITNNATAARIVTRVTDGLSLEIAIARTIAELRNNKGQAEVIALDAKGSICQSVSRKDTPVAFAAYDGKEVITFVQVKQ